jgi:uncharacterized membrane protein required for colicin V production
MALNAIDILLVVIVLLSLGNGYRRGFTNGIIDLACWTLSLVAGLRFYQPVARWLAPRVDFWSEAWDQPIAFILVAIAAGAGASARLRTAATVSKDFHDPQQSSWPSYWTRKWTV